MSDCEETGVESTIERAVLFSKIAGRYDLVNRVISFGLDNWWRKKTAALLGASKGSEVADLCSGTGELALAIARAKSDIARISCYDISEKMLNIARGKHEAAIQKNPEFPEMTFTRVDCSELPCGNESFDYISCGFGLRNIENPGKALVQMYRVAKHTARLCILEFTLPKSCWVRNIYLLYFRFILPFVAGALGGNRDAYEYFVKSVCRWESQTDLASMLAKTGFKNIRQTRLTLGIATIYTAEKL